MGWFSSSTKDRGWEAIPLAPSQEFADQFLWDLIKRIETFAARKIAPMTPAERGAVGIAEKTVAEGIPGVGEARQALTKRMDEPFDINQVPGIKGLFSKILELGSNLLTGTKRGLALTGNLPSESSRGAKIYGRTGQDIMNELTTSASNLIQPYMLDKLSLPERVANLGVQDVTTRTGIGTTVGGLPRQIEQSIFDAILEAVRMTQTFPYTAQVPVAQNIMNQERYAFNEGVTSPGIFSQIANMVSAFRGGGVSGGGGAGTSVRTGSNVGVPWQYRPSTQYGQYGAAFPS